MMHQTLYLSFTMPDGEAKTIELKPQAGDAIQIGRNRASQIKLNLPSLSRAHARFFYESGVFWVEDLGSSNGTFVNKEQIHHVRISPGDLIQCGEFELQVLSHSSTSVYQSAPQVEEAEEAEEAEELVEVEVIADDPSPLPSQSASLEPRPRPPMPKLSAPPRAHPASLPTFNHTALNSSPHSAPGALHSKAPTDRPLERRPSTSLSLPPQSPSVSPAWQGPAQSEASAHELTQLREERESLKLNISELQEQLTNLNAQAEAERMIYEQNKGALKSLEQAKTSLQGELELAQKELTELKSSQGDQRDTSNKQQQQLEAALTEVSELREALEEARRELNLSREREREREEGEASSEATHAQERWALQEELNQHKQDLDELTQARALAQEALEKARGELQGEREQWQRERAALQAQLAELKERSSELTLANQTTQAQRFILPEPNHNATSPDWAAHQARFEQLSQTLTLLKSTLAHTSHVADAPDEALTQAQELSQEQPPQAQQPPQQPLMSPLPQDQKPREWRGLV